MPAKKPTRVASSSVHMLRRLGVNVLGRTLINTFLVDGQQTQRFIPKDWYWTSFGEFETLPIMHGLNRLNLVMNNFLKQCCVLAYFMTNLRWWLRT